MSLLPAFKKPVTSNFHSGQTLAPTYLPFTRNSTVDDKSSIFRYTLHLSISFPLFTVCEYLTPPEYVSRPSVIPQSPTDTIPLPVRCFSSLVKAAPPFVP